MVSTQKDFGIIALMIETHAVQISAMDILVVFSR